MNDTLKFWVKIFGFIFAALVIAYSSVLTYLMAGRLVPGNFILQLATVLLFDGGALIWFFQFVCHAKGTAQWGFAGLGFVVGLLGAVVMAAGELIMSQNLVVFSDMSRLGWLLIGTVVVALITHITLTYLFHISDPALMNSIENAQAVAKIVRGASIDAHAELDRKQHELGRGIADSIYAQAIQQIETVTAFHIRNKRLEKGKTDEFLHGNVLSGVARDVPLMPMTTTPGGNGRKQIYSHKPANAKRGLFKRGAPKRGPAAFNASAAPTVIVTAPPGVQEAHQPRPPSPTSFDNKQ
jgi:hypothetical protein